MTKSKSKGSSLRVVGIGMEIDSKSPPAHPAPLHFSKDDTKATYPTPHCHKVRIAQLGTVSFKVLTQ
jgi:hypothetical protein